MKSKLKKTETLKWGIRNWIQLGVFILTLVIGLQFFIYIHQALNHSTITVHRPPGVEGFLPIGALMGWKLFLATGIWDPVHPAAMVILFLFGGLVYTARVSGHWQTRIPESVFRMVLERIDSPELTHP